MRYGMTASIDAQTTTKAAIGFGCLVVCFEPRRELIGRQNLATVG